MNYRHAFHAGNFADVHKHVVLLELLRHLHKKAAPFFLLDSHAGRGAYDLQAEAASRGGEWQHGVGRLQTLAAPPPTLEHYASLVRNAHGNTASTIRFYPGSPLLAVSMLREGDRAVFVEKHPDEAAALKAALGATKRVSVQAQDGYAAIKAHLPPKENRGLVFVDPPYEADSEFADATRAVQLGLQRWRSGMFCLWYPIKAGGAHKRLHRTLVDAQIKKILALELTVRPEDSPLGLNGSGMLVVNAPWQFDTQMETLQRTLHNLLAADGAGTSRVAWLATE